MMCPKCKFGEGMTCVLLELLKYAKGENIEFSLTGRVNYETRICST